LQRAWRRGQFRLPQWAEDRRRAPRGLPVRRGARLRPGDRQLPDARLADLASALLGLSYPDYLLCERRDRAGARRAVTGRAARHERLPAVGHRTLTARQRAGVRQHHLPKMRWSCRARDRYAGWLCLFVLVLSALRLAALRRRAVRAKGG